MTAHQVDILLAVGQVVAALALTLSAFFTYRSADAAEKSVEKTEESVRGQLLTRLLDEFGSTEYLRAARTLDEWNAPESGIGNLPESDLHRARRLVKSYFRKVYHLHQREYFTDHDLRDCLAERSAVGILLEKVEPAERKVRAGYKRRIFDFYDEFYDQELDRPLRDYTPPSDEDGEA